jgi:hypothetical protein
MTAYATVSQLAGSYSQCVCVVSCYLALTHSIEPHNSIHRCDSDEYLDPNLWTGPPREMLQGEAGHKIRVR